jgi:hypothetical protein
MQMHFHRQENGVGGAYPSGVSPFIHAPSVFVL